MQFYLRDFRKHFIVLISSEVFKSLFSLPSFIKQASSRIRACLLNERAEGRLSFEKASDLFKRKKLPKVYSDKIAAYLDIHSS